MSVLGAYDFTSTKKCRSDQRMAEMAIAIAIVIAIAIEDDNDYDCDRLTDLHFPSLS